MVNRRRSDRLIITLSPEVVDRLKAHGARSDRSHGPFNYTRQLTRAIMLYESVVNRSDPRQTRALPQEHYDLILDLLQEPHELGTFHLVRLGEYLSEIPAFSERTRALGLDPAQFADAITAFTFAEKVHLLDSAQVRNAATLPRPRRT
jgi:hypothetical protein